MVDPENPENYQLWALYFQNEAKIKKEAAAKKPAAKKVAVKRVAAKKAPARKTAR